MTTPSATRSSNSRRLFAGCLPNVSAQGVQAREPADTDRREKRQHGPGGEALEPCRRVRGQPELGGERRIQAERYGLAHELKGEERHDGDQSGENIGAPRRLPRAHVAAAGAEHGSHERSQRNAADEGGDADQEGAPDAGDILGSQDDAFLLREFLHPPHRFIVPGDVVDQETANGHRRQEPDDAMDAERLDGAEALKARGLEIIQPVGRQIADAKNRFGRQVGCLFEHQPILDVKVSLDLLEVLLQLA